MPVTDTFFAPYSFTLAAGAETSFPGGGKFVYISEASGALQVGLDDKSYFSAALGFEFRTADGESFAKVRVSNPGAVTLTGTIWIGDGSIRDTRLNMVRGRSACIVSETPNGWDTAGYVVNGSAGIPVTVALADDATAWIVLRPGADMTVWSDSGLGLIYRICPANVETTLQFNGNIYARGNAASPATFGLQTHRYYFK